jgi:branched-chain amino acid transport system substrate-binding protein
MQVPFKLVAAAAAAIFVGSVSAQDLVVKIGHVAPTSGGIAHLGKDNENGARMAIDELNAKGVTIGGKKAKFELLAEDDAADPKQGTAVANKLVDAKVNGVIGHLNSGTVDPGVEDLQRRRHSADLAVGDQPEVHAPGLQDDVSRRRRRRPPRRHARPLRRQGAEGQVDRHHRRPHRVRPGRRRRSSPKAVKASGGTIQDQQFTTDKATDFTAILTAVKAKKPDFIFYGGMDAVAGPMIRQMKQLGINAKFLGGDGICTGELPKLSGGAMADGQVVCAEAGGVEGSQKVGMDKFRDDFKKKFNTDVQIYAPYVYDAVNVMVAAMVKAGSADPNVYLPVLAKTEGYKGVTGVISFDNKGDVKNGALTLYTYKGDKREQMAVVR